MRDLSRLRIAVLTLHGSWTGVPGKGASGGLNVYVEELCQALAVRGAASDIVVRVPAGASEIDGPLAPGCRLVPVAVGPAGDLRAEEERALLPDLARAVARRIDGDDYDAISSHYWVSGAVALALRDRWPRPWLHAAHTWAAMKNARLAPGAPPDPTWRESLERDVARAADLVLAASALERDFLLEHEAAARCAIVTPGVDTDLFSPRPSARCAPWFVVVGRLERLKRVELALRGLAQLPPGSARLVVVGGDADEERERDRLQEQAFALGIADHVRFAGPVARTELRGYYAGAVACLVPSCSETFGLVALEAMACGAPVVTNPAVGVSGLLVDGESALLVRDQDYGGAMRRLLDDPGLRARLGAAGRRLALAHTWDGTAREWLERVRPVLELRPIRA